MSLIEIVNKKLMLTLGMNDSGFALLGMKNERKVEFIAHSAPALWKVDFISSDGVIHETVSAGMPEVIEEGDTRNLIWKNPGYGKVRVSVTLDKESDNAEFKLSVEDVDPAQSVQVIHFPCFDWQVDEGNECKVIQPEDVGLVFPDPMKTLPSKGIYDIKKFRNRSWPNGFLSLQFMALERSGDLAYFAAHDYTGIQKSFNWECDRERKALTFRPHIHAPRINGASYQTCPWIMALSDGDWYDAATRYRKFALKAPWLKHGPLEDGKKTPLWLLKTPLVTLRMLRGDGYTADDIIREQEFFNTPIMVHYYRYNLGEKFAPVQPELRKEIRKMLDHGIKAMPYMDFYSLFNKSKYFDGYKQCAIVDETGKDDSVTWTFNEKLVTMCPGSLLWRHACKQDALRMVEMGMRGIYHDEFGMSPPLVCSASGHDHVPGDPTSYIKCANQLFEELKQEANDVDEEGIIFASEGCGEPFIENIDTFLAGNDNSPYMKPIFSAVYHDYVMGFGRYMFFADLTGGERFKNAIETKNAEQFICGWQFGWNRVPWCMYIDKYPETAKFIRMLAKVRYEHYKYLACGKMLRPLELDVPEIKVCWATSWKDETGTEMTLPAVMNSVWQTADTTIGVFLVNVTDNEMRFSFKMPSIQLGDSDDVLKHGGAANYRYLMPEPSPAYCLLYQTDGSCRTEVAEGNTLSGFNITMPPRSVMLVKVNGQRSNKIHYE